MPMFYFHLYDGASLLDDEGTNLIDIASARDHAAGVARELAFKKNRNDGGGLVELDHENPRQPGHRTVCLGDVGFRTRQFITSDRRSGDKGEA
jgi:hypothetical protein